MSELHTRLENSLAENAMLTARVEHFHELEGNYGNIWSTNSF